MDDLIEALQIFRKYKNLTFPTACYNKTLYIFDVCHMEEEDHNRVLELGFEWDEDKGEYYSFKYGS